MNEYNVLIIEDHPLITEAYKKAFSQISLKNPKLNFIISTANNCDTAYLKIKEASKRQGLDIVFLDIKLPPSQKGVILSGEDLGLKIIELLPNSKIIVSTTFNDNYRMNSIFKNLNPEGFLIKNDLNPKELVLAIESIIEGNSYYSKSVIELMRKLTANDFLIDAIDRKLLYELSKGTKMSQLPDIIPLSISALEKRKRVLKEIFDLTDKEDRDLFRIAEEKGFI
ncbi:Oxygen regulatory protein NreC [Mariniflexile rhizosphaerae]|uniref:response regulator transcription factor n=1 Tax=unclassified Mariniflexile TaxID=2643887 RepID=UPI000CB73AA9|nr:response regulator transcription factor [Mariniflexile sp. TRM1-10]AXP80666.1 Oxygen regulatory protein NreC [Mariniflexile sp. TRM1-10]PLB17778.1 MAG: Response regulator containing a CheY-like receiver domain [Flavobacteriaceae bacterium FS1-H7996/R]